MSHEYTTPPIRKEDCTRLLGQSARYFLLFTGVQGLGLSISDRQFDIRNYGSYIIINVDVYDANIVVRVDFSQKSIDILEFQVNPTKAKLGTRIFGAMVDIGIERGFGKITCIACNDYSELDYKCAYIVAAIFGFSMSTDNIPRYLERLKDRYDGYIDLYDLLKTKEGREWWKFNGIPWMGIFDLTPNSINLQRFYKYKGEHSSNLSSKRRISLLKTLNELRKKGAN